MQVLLIFSDVWIIALEVFFSVKWWKIKIQGHKWSFQSQKLWTLGLFFSLEQVLAPSFLSKPSTCNPSQKFQSGFGLCNVFRGFLTCSGKVLTAYLKYRSLLQRAYYVCNVLNSQRCLLLGFHYLTIFPYTLNLYSEPEKILLLSFTQTQTLGWVLSAVGTNMGFPPHLNDYWNPK